MQIKYFFLMKIDAYKHMTYDDIQTLTRTPENGALEFKETTGQLERGMETLQTLTRMLYWEQCEQVSEADACRKLLYGKRFPLYLISSICQMMVS